MAGFGRLRGVEVGARIRRSQHDEAAKNSEKTRLSRDIDRHKHNRENYQVVGGTETHPAMPRHKKPANLPEEGS